MKISTQIYHGSFWSFSCLLSRASGRSLDHFPVGASRTGLDKGGLGCR